MGKILELIIETFAQKPSSKNAIKLPTSLLRITVNN